MSDESKAYQRGRYASEKRWRAKIDRVIEIARGIQSRAECGAGVCRDCRYFSRFKDTRWGTCTASGSGDITWVTSALVTWFQPDGPCSLNVGEGFGCIHWAAKGRK